MNIRKKETNMENKTWLTAVKGLIPALVAFLGGLGIGNPTVLSAVQEVALALLEVALKLFG